VFLSITAASFRRKAVYFAIGAIVTYFINILRIVSIFVIAVNSGDWMRFHNIYGPLYSIAWVTVYPLIMIASEFYLRKLR
ncbi:MAG TPA: hypothetical protein VMS94_03080, partial [Acidobacteriota bacterium]|nr:hypothetical protein [Acidobacteriota bacterium]